MQENVSSAPPTATLRLVDANPANAGAVEIAGRFYLTADRLATTLGVTVRTLARWDAARIGPPKIKIGKLVLFDLAKVPDWLAAHTTESVRTVRHRR